VSCRAEKRCRRQILQIESRLTVFAKSPQRFVTVKIFLTFVGFCVAEMVLGALAKRPNKTAFLIVVAALGQYRRSGYSCAGLTIAAGRTARSGYVPIAWGSHSR
jgi:hypothetical protein